MGTPAGRIEALARFIGDRLGHLEVVNGHPEEVRAMANTRKAITRERIRKRAYELCNRNHRPNGLDMQFWLAAESELRAELEERCRPPEHGLASDDAAASLRRRTPQQTVMHRIERTGGHVSWTAPHA